MALALVLLLFVGAAVTALLSARGIEGAVPGKGGLLSVAVTDAGFLVGTTTGAFASPDGRTWSRVEALSGPSPVAGDGERALVASGSELVSTTDLRSVRRVAALPAVPTALAAAPDGIVYAIDRFGRLARVDRAAMVTRVGRPGPASALGLAVLAAPSPVVYAAGLAAGLWRSEDGGEQWFRLLGTPAQAILPDAASTGRILLGTPGGLLVSRDGGRSWDLTALQVAVRGIARRGDRTYALTGDRLLLVSLDGERDWQPLARTAGARFRPPPDRQLLASRAGASSRRPPDRQHRPTRRVGKLRVAGLLPRSRRTRLDECRCPIRTKGTAPFRGVLTPRLVP